jgi:hypothetical protein
MKNFLRYLALIALAETEVSRAAVSYYQTDNYLGRDDNPFWTDVTLDKVYLENFEQRNLETPPYNYLTTPYAQGWNGTIGGAPGHGVQEDLAKSGDLGHTWSSSGGRPATTKPPTGIHFDFTPDPQGRLPEYAGAALLGRFDENGTGNLYNSIFVYDKDGLEVTGGAWKFVRPPVSAIPSDPAEYFLNFYGVQVPGGISRIHFRDFLEVDHLTYGYSAIPEPASAGLAAAAALAFGLRRKRLA